MGDVTGPISTLPGSSHDFPDGAVCDDHPARPAVARIQGETDSFGSEMWDMCEQCREEYRTKMRDADTSGVCDWCGEHKPKLRPRRDYEEGLCGRVYDVCPDCIQRVNDDAEKELGTYWGD